jgi:hypothetical protein
MTPLPAATALDAYFLEARSKLLDLAGILDRIGRGADADVTKRDVRLAKILQALTILQNQPEHRAKAIQELFSLDYDPNWKVPEPK